MQDPSQFHLKLPINHSSLTESSNKNTRGRPLKSNTVKFGPQPASTVSQMLKRRIEVVNGNTRQPIISKIICNTEENNQAINRRLIATYRSKSNIKLKSSSDVSKEYICEYSQCPYKTKISSNLIKHKRTHTSEKPFLCDQCTFRTNFINSLKVHRRIHTTDRPYACKYCDYKCNSSSNLKKHCHHRHLNKQEIL